MRFALAPLPYTLATVLALCLSACDKRPTTASATLPQPVAPLDRNTVPEFAKPTPGDESETPGPRVANSLILRKFDDATFTEVQAAGKPILLVFSKSDCPNCTLQAPTLERLLKEDEFKGIEVFQIDFVNQKDLAARFNMNAWSALLGMKGAEIRFRSVGLTKPADLRRELRRIL